MALMVTGPNQRILGGISAPSTNISSAFQAGQQANLQRQDTKQIMRSREQQMALNLEAEKRAKAQEARAQAAFEAQQAARAQAAARAAQERAAMSTLMQGLSGVGGTPTAGVSGAAPVAPVATSRAGLALPTSPSAPTPAPTAGVPLSMDMTPTGPAGGVQVASSDPQEAFRAAFQARPDLFGGGGEFPTGGAGTDTVAPQRMFMTPESTAVRAGLAQAVSLPPVGGYGSTTARDMQIADTQRKVDTLNAQIQSITAALRAPGSQADPGATSRVIQQLAAERDALQASMPISNAPAIPRDVFSEEGSGVAGLPPSVDEQITAASGVRPASPEAAAAEAPTTAEEAAPVVTNPMGGLQLNFGAPVQLSFGEVGAEGNASRMYVAAPERIFQELEMVSRQSQRLQLLANYYQQTNNVQGLVGVMNQLDELTVEQQYLDGMTAIVGIQQENFGPVQALLQQRFPGRQVEVRPYTDGTAEIFLDGESEARLTWDDMATNLRSVYDRGFIEQQQALAEQARDRSNELWKMQTEELLRTAREIAVANNQAEIDRLEGSGRIQRIGETSNGTVIFESIVDGVPIQFVYRETKTRDPRTGEEIPALIATPLGNSALTR